MDLPIRVKAFDEHGITLIPPTHTDFDVLARPLIGRVADIGLKLKPMLMIVSNESPQTVVSSSKTWTARYADGRTSAIRSHTSFPEAVCGDILIASHEERGDADRFSARGERESRGTHRTAWKRWAVSDALLWQTQSHPFEFRWLLRPVKLAYGVKVTRGRVDWTHGRKPYSLKIVFDEFSRDRIAFTLRSCEPPRSTAAFHRDANQRSSSTRTFATRQTPTVVEG